MSFFQNSVLEKHLNSQDTEVVGNAYQLFKDYFQNPEIQQNIRNAKEEQFQEGFLRELFVKILGYTLNPKPDFNLTTELKNEKGAKKADGAILKDGKALAVIELKGTDTKDLDKINVQAFNYKNNQSACVYVITSNFEKLRFFIHNSVDHIEFNLFTITKDDFRILWLCLNANNILNGLPVKIKEESLLEEDKVTKQLYKDYAAFRTDLWQNMVKNNEQQDKLLLFKKTQKLLDRFLFVFFSEDKGLLPPNSISEIVQQWEKLKELDEYRPLYERFKKYFGYLNTGWKGKKYEIFAYNGGLFLPDETLDNLVVDDDILHKHVMKLTNYDFQTEVDVNILGHIFENSLNEIENITAQLEGQEIDKSKSKRKKDGVFYTPKYITKYIVDNTIGKLCDEKKVELGVIDEEYAKGRRNRKKEIIKKLDDSLQEYRNWLLEVTICDPASGSGAFLNQALEFLISEHRYIDELSAQLFSTTDAGVMQKAFGIMDIRSHILEKNLYGVDINEESVEIAKLSLWLRTAEKGRKLTTLNNNIKCGNSLIDDQEVAGDKAFNWQEEFPTVFDKGGFDVVIGNPPYVSKTFTTEMRNYIKQNYKTAEYQLDLYVAFMEIASQLAKDYGRISYIVPNSWLKNLMFSQCRYYLATNLSFEVIIPNLDNVFSDASVDTLIFVSRRLKNTENEIIIGEFRGNCFFNKHKVLQSRFLENDKFIFDVEINSDSVEIFRKIDESSVRLNDICDVTRGINPYDKYRGQSEDVIKNKLYHASFKKDETFVPEIRGRHVKRYFYEWDGISYVSYGDWLAAPREPKYFTGERIVCRQVLGSHLNCCVISEDIIIDQSVFIGKIKEKNNDKYFSKYVLCLFTSKLLSFYFRYKANEFDALFPKIKIGEFKNLPIKSIEIGEQQCFVEMAEKMESLFAQNATVGSKFLKYIQSQFSIEIFNKKLQDWQELGFGEFIKELNNAIRKVGGEKLSRSNEMEWMEVFEEKKAEAQALKIAIEKADKEIDQMVYKLYGLSEEEIMIVEGK